MASAPSKRLLTVPEEHYTTFIFREELYVSKPERSTERRSTRGKVGSGGERARLQHLQL
jgi:hypothetical protein